MVDVAAKQCFKCQRIKPIDDFYRHPQMADGRLGKCKECNKVDVQQNYAARREQYSEYERVRNCTPKRRAKRQDYQRKMRAAYPEKNAARQAVSRAVRSGKLVRPDFCGQCGNVGKAQAHHTDYRRPLDVLWLCFTCHREHGHGQQVTQKTYQQ